MIQHTCFKMKFHDFWTISKTKVHCATCLVAQVVLHTNRSSDVSGPAKNRCARAPNIAQWTKWLQTVRPSFIYSWSISHILEHFLFDLNTFLKVGVMFCKCSTFRAFLNAAIEFYFLIRQFSLCSFEISLKLILQTVGPVIYTVDL